jgi:hypothetical protein
VTVSLLVIGYPELSPADLAWIQTIRKEHDPHFELVGPHFTLVFATEKLSRDELTAHVHSQTGDFGSVSFVLRSSIVVKDVADGSSYLFLVPDEGYRQIVRLHDLLYTGSMADEPRLDIPFIPHVTAGIFENAGQSGAVADSLNSQGFQIEGQLSVVDVVSYDNDRIVTVQRAGLGGL